MVKLHPETQVAKNLENSQIASVNENDIGLYIANNEVPDFKKESLLKNLWMPSNSHKFYEQILGKKRRTFQLSWMKRFTWLAYSDAVQGALCKVCVLFANKSGVGKGFHQSPQCLVKRAFKNWKDAIEVFQHHEKTSYHREALVCADNFLKVCDGKQEDVYCRLNQDASKQIKKNRDMLAAVIQTILLCGRQEIALRGTDDSGRISLEEPTCNDGNFRSLVRYRAKFGDKILADHLSSSGGNELYTSSIVQNELIGLIGEDIKSQIIQRALKANFFSVLADGTTDIRRIEQFSLCIRYVDMHEFKIREDFIEFVPVYDASGEALANLIKSSIQCMGLNLSQLRGQGYDGASAMKGQFRGVQACIKKDYPKAIYTHCTAHCLNLCLADASKVQAVRNAFGTISEVCSFFRSSSKRANILKEELKSSSRPAVSCLKKYCETRWVERHEAVAIFAETLPEIIEALEKVMENQRESDDTARASSLHKNICAFNFIVGLSICEKFLGITYNLSEYLQGKYVDLNIAIERVDLINEKFNLMRVNAEEQFKELYEKSVKIASSFAVQPDMPRRVGSQRHRENYLTDCAEEYYRKSIFIPYLDEIMSSLEQRFLHHRQEIIALHYIMPLNTLQASYTDISPAFEFYLNDLRNQNYSILEGEWDLWTLKWKKVFHENPDSLPKYAIDALKECNNDNFPNIAILLEVLAVLPVSTASVERSFSTLKRLKTYLRNSTGNDRLTGLALMSIHRNVKVNEKLVIDKYAAINPRRKKFI